MESKPPQPIHTRAARNGLYMSLYISVLVIATGLSLHYLAATLIVWVGTLAMPFFLVSMVVGVVIAIFQAATQINEQTMTFVPKFLSILVVMGFLGSSILSTLQEFFQRMLTLMIGS